MAHGIIIYGQDGSTLLTPEFKICRKHSICTIYSVPQGSYVDVTVPGMLDDGSWFILREAIASAPVQIFAGFFRVYGDPYYAINWAINFHIIRGG